MDGRRMVVVAALGLAVGATTVPVSAAPVLCLKKSGVVVVRDPACKRKETSLDLAQFGALGPQGVPGQTGQTGPTGPSDAFAVFRDTVSPPPLPAAATTTIATLNLEPGKYVIFGNIPLDDIAGPHTPRCVLAAEGDFDQTYITADGIGGYECALHVVHEFTTAGSVTLALETPAGSVIRVGDVKIIAIRVGTLTNTAVTG